MNDIFVLSHFHRDFPFNHASSWIKAGYAGGTGPYEWHPPSDSGNFINVTPGGVTEYKHYYTGVTEHDFLRAMGQQASEYWLWKNCQTDFIGCTTYRRYLMIDGSEKFDMVDTTKASMSPTQESADFLSSEVQKEKALYYLEKVDVITNKHTVLSCTIEEQYLQSQQQEYWNLFLTGIVELFPDYRKHIGWFKQNIINFETCYIMRKQAFKKYASEYFELMEYIWKNTSNPYPTQQTTSEPLPWRYPGFLGERFFPFFLHANDLTSLHVPLIILE
jgi:hypothetical protein